MLEEITISKRVYTEPIGTTDYTPLVEYTFFIKTDEFIAKNKECLEAIDNIIKYQDKYRLMWAELKSKLINELKGIEYFDSDFLSLMLGIEKKNIGSDIK